MFIKHDSLAPGQLAFNRHLITRPIIVKRKRLSFLKLGRLIELINKILQRNVIAYSKW